MSTDPSTDVTIPPQGSAPVYRRLARSYGPLAILAFALMLMALLVPTMDREEPADAPADPSTEASESGLVVSGGWF